MFGGDYSGAQGQAMGGNDFAAMPRLIQGKPKFKDPYGRNIEEYFPQNIMHDRRIMRGSTYAAMVIPAGTNPDTMVMDKSYPKKRTFKKPGVSTKKTKNIYPNREISTPEPVHGRSHMEVQTSPYKEILTDKPPEREQGIATEFYLDRPPVPLFQPKMPSKENCKATQIYEGDYELFNFNEEVEPMLNVLCSKTLEQSRMEVLEEHELAIIKSQQKMYEEMVNAELVTAQRFEAAEQRCKEEKMRRQVQDKHRKLERKAAHQKLNARQFTKNYLGGIREDALGQLSSMGVLTAPKKKAIEQEVMPWLMGQIVEFLHQDKATTKGSDAVVEDGIIEAQNEHKAIIKAKYDRIRQAELDAIEAERQKKLRREQRALAREKRKKDQALEKFKDEVDAKVIFKGDVVSVLQQNLVEPNGLYQNQPYLGAPGGHLLQIYYVLEEIFNKYPHGLKQYMEKKIQNDDEDYFLRPNNPRELLLPEHLMPFFMTYLKDMKNESLDIQIGEEALKFLDENECPLDDLSKLEEEKLSTFKELFLKNRVSPYHRNLGKSMDMLLDYIVDILSRRVPIEGVGVKVDQIINKIKLVPVPEDVVEEDKKIEVEKTLEDGTVQKVEEEVKRNTNERALVYITIPQIEEEEQINIEVTGDDKDAPKTKTVKKMVDEDQKEKALAVQGRDVPDLGNFWVISQYAAKAYREEFLDYISRTFPDFFEENEDQEAILKAVNEQGQKAIDDFIKENCGEYEQPKLEFPKNAHDLE